MYPAGESQQSRRDKALAAGFDPHPDDRLPPAAHLRIDGDPLRVFASEAAASPYACSDCNTPVHEGDMAPSCGAHYLCVSCFETSDFRCRECGRVWDEVNR